MAATQMTKGFLRKKKRDNAVNENRNMWLVRYEENDQKINISNDPSIPPLIVKRKKFHKTRFMYPFNMETVRTRPNISCALIISMLFILLPSIITVLLGNLVTSRNMGKITRNTSMVLPARLEKVAFEPPIHQFLLTGDEKVIFQMDEIGETSFQPMPFFYPIFNPLLIRYVALFKQCSQTYKKSRIKQSSKKALVSRIKVYDDDESKAMPRSTFFNASIDQCYKSNSTEAWMDIMNMSIFDLENTFQTMDKKRTRDQKILQKSKQKTNNHVDEMVLNELCIYSTRGVCPGE